MEKDAPDIAALNAEREKQEKRLNTAMENLTDSRELVTELTHQREKLDEILRDMLLSKTAKRTTRVRVSAYSH